MKYANITKNLPVDHEVALCVFATGRYTEFLPRLIATVRKFFLAPLYVDVVVLTNQTELACDCDQALFVPQLPWPLGSMLRYHFLAKARETLSKYKYIFMCDADMLFAGHVGTEVLGRLVATESVENVKAINNVPFCRNKASTAYIPAGKGQAYYAGGFQGGTSAAYLSACDTIMQMIDEDLNARIIAHWHDESYWNAYLFRSRPTVALSSDYCASDTHMTAATKIVALTKNHKLCRTGVEGLQAVTITSSTPAPPVKLYNAIVLCKRDEHLIPWHLEQSNKLQIPMQHCLYYGMDVKGQAPTPPAGIDYHVVEMLDLYEHLPLKTYGLMKHALTIPGWTHILKTDVNSYPTRIDLDAVAKTHMAGYRALHKARPDCVIHSIMQPALREPYKGELPSIWCGGPAYTVSRELVTKIVERGIWYAAGWPAEDLMVAKVAEELGWTPQTGVGYWSDGRSSFGDKL